MSSSTGRRAMRSMSTLPTMPAWAAVPQAVMKIF
jgi:hypothetical protein